MNKELFDQIEEFRADRLKKLNEGKGPVPLDRGKFIVHLVPEQTLKNPSLEFDVSKLANDVRALPLFGHKMSPGSLDYNLDGRICRSLSSDDPVFSYVQFFRNGTVEAVEGFYLNRKDKDFPIFEYEQELLLRIGRYIEQMGLIGVDSPVVFLLSILGAAEFRLLDAPFKKDEMFFVPKEFTSEQHDPFIVLRPTIDQLWQAAGKEKSPSFDRDGKYHAR
jgi:hypothetical protein